MASKASVRPVLLPLANLRPHPGNPRLILDVATVAAIADALRRRRTFPPKHAISVRPIEGGLYQIVSGHQRVAAASEVGLKKIYAFAERMSDEEAYLELMLANSQNELSPLEKALHSLRVPVTPGRKGGGQAEWARRVGLAPAALSLYRRGARVFEAVRADLSQSDVGKCRMLAEQLSAIGHRRVDATRWRGLVRACLDEGLTLEATRARANAGPERAAPYRRSNAGAPSTSSIDESLARSGSAPPAATPRAGSTSTLATRTPETHPSAAAAAIASRDLGSSEDGATSSNPAQAHARSATSDRDTAASEARRHRPPSTAAASRPHDVHIVATQDFESIMRGVNAGPPDDSVVARVKAFHVAAQAVVAVLQHRTVPVLVRGEQPFPVPPFSAPDPEDPELDENEVHEGWDLTTASNRTEIEHEALFWMSGIRGAALMMSAEYESHPVDPDGEDGAYATHLLDGFRGSHRTSANYAALIGAQADDLLQPYWGARVSVTLASTSHVARFTRRGTSYRTPRRRIGAQVGVDTLHVRNLNTSRSRRHPTVRL